MMSKTAIAVAAGLAFATVAYGGGWTEQGDAGDLPGSAQITNGSGPLLSITGSTGGGDGVDMYAIFIDDPVNFIASTAGAGGGFGGNATFDTQLWLFDANGFGLLGNDDFPGASFRSEIRFPAADGPNAGQFPGPGNYFLAISGFNNDPLSQGGAIFNQQSFTQISGPDGPGGGLPIIGWSGGGATGNYTIALQGASFKIPTPGALSLFGIAGLAAIRRRRA